VLARHRTALVALAVAVAHFAVATSALRALLTAAGRDGGSPVLHGAVALLAFPLFYTPVPALLGGRPHTGWYVAALNAVLWGVVVALLLRRRARSRGAPRA
jgi:hypothetical protein